VENKYLQQITDAVLKELRKFEIVTPEIFSSLYKQKAKELNLLDKIDLKELSSESVLNKYYEIQEMTKENVEFLSENASKAKEAIANKDETMLNDVNSKMESLMEKISKLQKQVYLDELTNVYNRKYLFEEILDNDFFKEQGIITFIDLDKFKQINDNFGHLIGDKVLSLTAKMLGDLENSDVIRYGGDEFIVISKSNRHEVKEFFEKLTQTLSKKSFKHQDKKFKIAFSYGIEKFKKDDSFSDIVEKVDKVMYEQKRKKKEREKELEVA
jgi:diguanylate cyclase (GGDEF)-like protein